MNTATRVYGKQVAVRKTNAMSFSWQLGLVLGLIVALSVSAFGLIYAKDLNRRLFIDYQTLEQQQQTYQTDWSKLLLEESTWSAQARIQHVATNRLNMEVPTPKKIVFLVDD